MSGSKLRRSLVGLAVTCLLASATATAADGIEYELQIESQSLGAALREFSKQSGLQVVFLSKIADGLDAPAVRGRFTADGALRALLEKSELTFVELNENTIEVQRKGSGARTSSGEKNIRLAAAQMRGATDAEFRPAGGESALTEDGRLTEIIVTASRRAENVQNVPMSISTIGNDDINRRNLVTQGDFLRSLPGVSQLETGAGGSFIVMRGIAINPTADGFSQGLTTAVFLGETPLSAGRLGQINLRLVDIDRVEVLRGPQGTSYGSGAISGAVRYIPNAPDSNELQFNTKMGVSHTSGYGSNGYNVEGMLNIPLVDDVLALRTVLYRHRDSGYIRNVSSEDPQSVARAQGLGLTDLLANERVGDTTATGGRVALRWQPADRFAMTLSYALQELEQDGDLIMHSEAGKYRQIRWQLTNTEFGGTDRRSDVGDIANALLELDLGWADLLSSTSYGYQDYTSAHTLGFNAGLGGNPVGQTYSQRSKALVEELRLTSKLDGPLNFIAGLYYESADRARHGDNQFNGTLAALNSLPQLAGRRSVGNFVVAQDTKQRAAYGELSYKLTDTLTASVGGRAFHYDTESLDVFDGYVFGGYNETRIQGAEDDGHVFKASLDYKPNTNTLLYATWSQGFRLGYTQAPLPLSCDANQDGTVDGLPGVPMGIKLVKSDKLENHEAGGKFTLFDSRMVVNTAVYDIDWTDLPVRLFPDPASCSLALTMNAGKARSRGVELESKFMLKPGITLSLSGSYTKSELAADSPGIGLKGDPLPGGPEFNASAGLEYDFKIRHYPAYLQTDVSYVGEIYGWIGQGDAPIGDYVQVNLRGGMDFARLSAMFYINNLTGSDPLVAGTPDFAYILRPRTVGLNFTYRY